MRRMRGPLLQEGLPADWEEVADYLPGQMGRLYATALGGGALVIGNVGQEAAMVNFIIDNLLTAQTEGATVTSDVVKHQVNR